MNPPIILAGSCRQMIEGCRLPYPRGNRFLPTHARFQVRLRWRRVRTTIQVQISPREFKNNAGIMYGACRLGLSDEVLWALILVAWSLGGLGGPAVAQDAPEVPVIDFGGLNDAKPLTLAKRFADALPPDAQIARVGFHGTKPGCRTQWTMNTSFLTLRRPS